MAVWPPPANTRNLNYISRHVQFWCNFLGYYLHRLFDIQLIAVVLFPTLDWFGTTWMMKKKNVSMLIHQMLNDRPTFYLFSKPKFYTILMKTETKIVLWIYTDLNPLQTWTGLIFKAKILRRFWDFWIMASTCLYKAQLIWELSWQFLSIENS